MLETLLNEGVNAIAVESETVDEKLLLRIYLRQKEHLPKRILLRCAVSVTRRRYRIVRTDAMDDGNLYLLEPEPKWRISMCVRQAALEADGNGDSFGERNHCGGKSLFALSDGMGSGKRAQEESQSAIQTLFRLYDAGMEKNFICENVNRMLMMRGSVDMYATLDAVSVDLNTGTAELLKFGTPPSYLLRGTTLYTLCGEALPCGILDDARPTVIPIEFHPEDILFLCTDGVSDALTEQLENVLLANAKHRDSADRILQAAMDTGQQDDLSVMILRVSQ